MPESSPNLRERRAQLTRDEILRAARRLVTGAAAEPELAVRFGLVLRESYGWSLDRLEDWIAATSRALVLGEPPGG